MDDQKGKVERSFSLVITVRVNKISQEDANRLENMVRDAADEFTTDVQAIKGAPRDIPQRP